MDRQVRQERQEKRREDRRLRIALGVNFPFSLFSSLGVFLGVLGALGGRIYSREEL
jgi:hypothetical protein